MLQKWQKRGDPVFHIDLRRWADVMVIAPLDANTMAKLACGICDNLLVSSGKDLRVIIKHLLYYSLRMLL